MATRIIFIPRKYVNKLVEELKTEPSLHSWKRIQVLYVIYPIYRVPVKDQLNAFITIPIPIHAYHSRMGDAEETKTDLFERRTA